MMSKILYLHGFASCGEGNKSKTLREYFGNEEVCAPDLPHSPEEAIAYLCDLIETQNIKQLIGSSLGGFYATYLAEKFKISAVLLNPSVVPWKTLALYTGWQKRFCDGKRFEFKESYLRQLEQLKVEPVRGDYLVLLQSGDEVLDYQIAKEYYSKHRVIVEYGGNHRFENIADYLPMIERYRRVDERC
ncbi:MAG: YqiA/YcfP family alpha/beta fold hydrolase [Sulfurimonas sp.]